MNGTMPIYSISAVARTIGVPVATLRTWEDRYSLVVPERSPSRHRLYSREQVDHLRFVKSQMDEGASAADAHRLLRERIAGAGSPAVSTEAPRPEPRLVLVAENDPYAAELQEYLLETEGYQVVIALDFESAGKTLERQLPSLVVLELLISGGMGLDLCRSIKRRDHAPSVLAVSTLNSQERALKAGADAFMSKPLDPSRFTFTVKRLVRSGVHLPEESEAV